MKKLFLVVFFSFLFSVHLNAQIYQVKLSVDFLPSIENPYKGPAQFGLADKTINFKGAAVEIRKTGVRSTPIVVGVSSGFMTGNILNRTLNETCPESSTCSGSTWRSDLLFLSGELLILYPFRITESLSVNSGLRGGIAYLSLRDRIAKTVSSSSEYAPSFAPVIEIELSVIGNIGLSVSGYYRFLETEIDLQSSENLQVSLSGPGITAGLFYNF